MIFKSCSFCLYTKGYFCIFVYCLTHRLCHNRQFHLRLSIYRYHSCITGYCIFTYILNNTSKLHSISIYYRLGIKCRGIISVQIAFLPFITSWLCIFPLIFNTRSLCLHCEGYFCVFFYCLAHRLCQNYQFHLRLFIYRYHGGITGY